MKLHVDILSMHSKYDVRYDNFTSFAIELSQNEWGLYSVCHWPLGTEPRFHVLQRCSFNSGWLFACGAQGEKESPSGPCLSYQEMQPEIEKTWKKNWKSERIKAHCSLLKAFSSAFSSVCWACLAETTFGMPAYWRSLDVSAEASASSFRQRSNDLTKKIKEVTLDFEINRRHFMPFHELFITFPYLSYFPSSFWQCTF